MTGSLEEQADAVQRRPRFGDLPHQELHPDLADELLTLWFNRSRNGGATDFGALLAEVQTGQRYTKARSR